VAALTSMPTSSSRMKSTASSRMKSTSWFTVGRQYDSCVQCSRILLGTPLHRRIWLFSITSL
jgi:hypothetical protein